MKISFILLFLFALPTARGDTNKIPNEPLDLITRLLGEQLSGDVADYKNASPEWKLVMESRIRYIIFTYWISIDKFGNKRSNTIEVRFGNLVDAIKENHSFERTFSEPNFITASDSFPKHAYTSEKGDRFEINSREEFEKENKKFLMFLDECVEKKE